MSGKRSKEKSSKKSNKTNKKNKSDKKKFSQKHPKLSIMLKILLLLIILAIVIGAGIVIGMLYGPWGKDFEITKEELTIGSSNSQILDIEGTKLAELSGDENRKIIRLDQMPDDLKNAYVAIEDERFYDHSGVDFKRTAAAILQYITHKGNSSFGGSTITQQLVKNITKESDRDGTAGIIRKVKEWAKAYQIERMISKNQILELYLNIIFVGGKTNNLGVEVGSEYYFNKPASELDLAECAFLAGINHSPNSYNPYGDVDHTELIKKRTKTVLNKMLELGMIDQARCDEATKKVDEGLHFEKAESLGTLYSYHTDATISQVIEDIAKEKGISKELASVYVYSSGLTIYSTQDSKLQSQMNEVMVEKASDYTRKSKKVEGATSQSAMVIIDNATGYVVGVVGGLGEKTESRGLNRATQSPRQTGSSIKPLTSLVPGINEGVITAATIYDDNKTLFPPNYEPKDYNAYKGLISIRSAITTSQNIPFIKVVSELTTTKAMDYLKKMGVTTLDDVNDLVLPATSIGGFTNGISPLEMAGAYATIANNGVYRRPLFYTKITDPDGNVVLEAKQNTEQVISEQAAYVIKNLLQSVVQSGGTATYCKISGIDTAAKTGTTNDNNDKWLCGFTNYYTAATWYGFDKNEEVVGSNNVAGRIWAAVMSKVHSGKEKSTFERPSGVVTATICRTSGKKATSRCSDVYEEVFVEGTVPGDCDAHSNSASICSDTGLLANQYCPNVVTKYYSYTVEKERLGLWKSLSSSVQSPPTTYCTTHNASNTKPAETHEDKGPTITLNGEAKMTLTVGENYTEKGATAKDDVDGDITGKISITGTVNTTKAGTYTVTYTVTNSRGKKATIKRTITVKEKSTPKPPTNTTTENKTSSNETEKNETNGNTTSSGNKNETPDDTTN